MSFIRSYLKMGRSACQKSLCGLFRQAAFRIAKLVFVFLFCNSAAAAGNLTRKETLTVSFHTILPSEAFDLAGFDNLISLVPLVASCNSAANLIESACLNIHYNIFCGKKQSDFSRFFRQLEVIL
ncbi:hypothetical protein [Faecousia intestinalis]|uniref:Uncharacterized protein n=1 Tax=Faecousia intestinalis TaxID=3133167 RepID=A0ABV1G4E2_9FIRM